MTADQFIAAFRRGFLPQLRHHPKAVPVLREALRAGDAAEPRLIHVQTTVPGGAMHYGEPVRAACLVAYCGVARGLATVGDVQHWFADSCSEARRLLSAGGGRGGFGAVEDFIGYWDTKQAEARAALLAYLETLP